MFNPCQPCCMGGACCPTWGPVLYGIFYPHDLPYNPLVFSNDPAPDYPPIYFLVNQASGDTHWRGNFIENWYGFGDSNFSVDLVCSPTPSGQATGGYVINVLRNGQPFISGTPISNYFTNCAPDPGGYSNVGDMWGYGAGYPENPVTYDTSNLWLGPFFYPRKLMPRAERKLIAEIISWSKSSDFSPPDNDLTGQHIILNYAYEVYDTYGHQDGGWRGVIPYAQNYPIPPLGTSPHSLHIIAIESYAFKICFVDDGGNTSPSCSIYYQPTDTSQLGFLYYLEGTVPVVYDVQSNWTGLSIHLRVRDPNLSITLNGNFGDGLNFACDGFNNINTLSADPVHGDWTYVDSTHYVTFYGMNTDLNGNYGIRCDFGIPNTNCMVSYLLPMIPYDYDPGTSYTLPLLSNGNANCSCAVVPDSITIAPIWP